MAHVCSFSDICINHHQSTKYLSPMNDMYIYIYMWQQRNHAPTMYPSTLAKAVTKGNLGQEDTTCHPPPVSSNVAMQTPVENGGCELGNPQTEIFRYVGNPAPLERWIIPLFIGFQPSKMVQDFFHAQCYAIKFSRIQKSMNIP